MRKYNKQSEVSENNSSKMFDESILEILTLHLNWLTSEGKEGSRAVFMHINFENFNFENFQLSKAVFKNCNLSKSKIGVKASEIFDTSFSFCDLSDTTFYSNLAYVVFEECKLENLTLNQIKISNSQFIKCSGEGITSIKSNFLKTKFHENNFPNSNFNSAKFESTLFEKNTLIIADFSYTEISKTTLSENIFNGSEFHSTIFIGVKINACQFLSFSLKGQAVKTSLKLTQFINCSFIACSFEEDEKSLKSKIVKTNHELKAIKEEKSIKKLCILTSILNVFLVLTIIFFPILIINFKFSVIEFIIYAIGLFLMSNALFLTSNILNTRLNKNTKLNSKIKNIYIIYFTTIANKSGKYNLFFKYAIHTLPSLILGYFWLFSLNFESFNISAIFLSLFFYTMLVSAFSFHKNSKQLGEFQN